MMKKKGFFLPLPKENHPVVNHPVVMVTWIGMAAYCNWRSEQEGLQECYDPNWKCDFSKHSYRLPTEAEWEYAARGGLSGCTYPWGNTIAPNQANYLYSDDPFECCEQPLTTPIGFYNGQVQQKKEFNWPSSEASYQTINGANGYGLYDVSGNVREYCNDWYSADYYTSRPDPDINPTGPEVGTYKVVKGADWTDTTNNLRVSYRHYWPISYPDFNYGFRIVLQGN
jgi:formylglycine-generating enzyme required for sulfatase activity